MPGSKVKTDVVHLMKDQDDVYNDPTLTPKVTVTRSVEEGLIFRKYQQTSSCWRHAFVIAGLLLLVFFFMASVFLIAGIFSEQSKVVEEVPIESETVIIEENSDGSETVIIEEERGPVKGGISKGQVLASVDRYIAEYEDYNEISSDSLSSSEEEDYLYDYYDDDFDWAKYIQEAAEDDEEDYYDEDEDYWRDFLDYGWDEESDEDYESLEWEYEDEEEYEDDYLSSYSDDDYVEWYDNYDYYNDFDSEEESWEDQESDAYNYDWERDYEDWLNGDVFGEDAAYEDVYEDLYEDGRW